MVTVKGTSDCVKFIISKRRLDLYKTLVRVPMNSEGGFMKICVSVFHIDHIETCVLKNQYLDASVQKAQFLAIVVNIPKNYNNVRKIIELLNLDRLSFFAGYLTKTYDFICNILL